jgi:hypothetical protein
MMATTVTAPAMADSLMAKHGTELYATIQQRLNSKTSQTGDPVTLVLHDGFFHKNPPELSGAIIEGHVGEDQPAGPTHKAKMSIIFDDMKFADGSTAPVDARLTHVKVLEPHTHHIRDAGLIIGGAIVGHAMGKHHGMNHGGLAGAAAGFALVSAMKSDIIIKQNSQLELVLKSDLVH